MLRWWWAIAGLLLLATIGGTRPTASLAGEAAGDARGSADSAAAPFCEQGTRQRANDNGSPDGHLVELWAHVFRTCIGAEGLPGFFYISANPDALPGLRFPDTLLELAVFSPFSPAAPAGEWSTDMRLNTHTREGGPIERRADRVIGDVVYEQYLIYGFLPDGTLIPAFVSFIPVPGSDAPDHRFGCTGPVVGLLRRDESYCWIWLRYKGLYAHIGFSHTKDFPEPIPIEQFDAYARDVLFVLTATDVTDRVGEFGHLNHTVIDPGPYGRRTEE